MNKPKTVFEEEFVNFFFKPHTDSTLGLTGKNAVNPLTLDNIDLVKKLSESEPNLQSNVAATSKANSEVVRVQELYRRAQKNVETAKKELTEVQRALNTSRLAIIDYETRIKEIESELREAVDGESAKLEEKFASVAKKLQEEKALFDQLNNQIKSADNLKNQAEDAQEKLQAELNEAEKQLGANVTRLAESFGTLADDVAKGCEVVLRLLPLGPSDSERSYVVVEGVSEVAEDHDAFISDFLSRDLGKQSKIKFRLDAETLEDRFQEFLDHISGDQIAEERDATSFINHLRIRYKSLSRASRDVSGALAQQLHIADAIWLRLTICAQFAKDLSDVAKQAAAQPQGTEESKAANELLAKAANLQMKVRKAQAICKYFSNFLKLNKNSIEILEQEYCSEENRKPAEDQSREISEDVEVPFYLRPWPLAYAVLVAALTKIALAQSNSETLFFQTIHILFVSFFATWALAIFMGARYRHWRMFALKTHMRRQLQGVIGARDDNADHPVRFPSVGIAEAAPKPWRVKAFEVKPAKNKSRNRRFAYNATALSIPLFLGFAAFSNQRPERQDFIARFADTAPCILAQGELVYATQNAYYVRSVQTGSKPEPSLVNTAVASVVRLVFPELGADVVRREHIVHVGSTGDLDKIEKTALLKCSQVDNRPDTFAINHSGNGIGPFGEASLEGELGELAKAFSALEKSGNSVGLIYDSKPTLTYNLGEDAIAALRNKNGNSLSSVGRQVTLPDDLHELRNKIETYLSVETVEEFDWRSFFATFVSLRNGLETKLADTVTISEKLSVADTLHWGWSFERPGETIPSSTEWTTGENTKVLLEQTNKKLERIADEVASTRNKEKAIEVHGLIDAIDALRQSWSWERLIAKIPSSIELQMGKNADQLLVEVNASLKRIADHQVATKKETAAITALGDAVNEFRSVLANWQRGIAPCTPVNRCEGKHLQDPVLLIMPEIPVTVEVNADTSAQPSPLLSVNSVIVDRGVTLETLKNTMIMPFFMGDAPGSDPMAALRYGAQDEKFMDPVFVDPKTQEKVTFLGRFAENLTQCLHEKGLAKLDIIGLASQSWLNPGSAQPEDLNIMLAEGRRIAVLRRLAQNLRPEVQDRVFVAGVHPQELKSLREISEIIGENTNIGHEVLSQIQRLSHPEELHKTRTQYVSAAGGGPAEQHLIEEFFARAAILRVLQIEDSTCAM